MFSFAKNLFLSLLTQEGVAKVILVNVGSNVRIPTCLVYQALVVGLHASAQPTIDFYNSLLSEKDRMRG